MSENIKAQCKYWVLKNEKLFHKGKSQNTAHKVGIKDCEIISWATPSKLCKYWVLKNEKLFHKGKCQNTAHKVGIKDCKIISWGKTLKHNVYIGNSKS